MALQYDSKFSLGNIITVLVLMGGLAVSWGTFTARQDEMAKEATALRQLVADHSAESARVRADQEGRIRAVEISSASMSSDLRSIQAGISRIERLLEAVSASGTRP